MSGKFINNPDVLLGQPQRLIDNKSERAAATSVTTPVYFWYFDNVPTTECRLPAYSQNMPRVHASLPASESIVNAVDGRVKVNPKDYEEVDGKYRAIVKLFLLYEGQVGENVSDDQASWAMATGWLVSQDVVVTAGHCSYDYSRGLGRLVKVKAFIGYSGRESVSNGKVKARWGSAIATTDGWINTVGGKETGDVSFIKLSKAFDASEVSKVYTWTETPISRDAAELGVVGYPGDIINDKGERGAVMHEMFKKTDFNLDKSQFHMLQYMIDTFGGNSGSPVFIKDADKLNAVGVHVLGGYNFNSASVIGGHYGNRFLAYFKTAAALNGTEPTGSTHPVATKTWLWMYNQDTTESIDETVIAMLNTTRAAAKTVTEDIAPEILDDETAINWGPKAGPQMGILAHAAIAAAGKLAADSVTGTKVEALAETRPYDGVLGRAVLAECALQCYHDLVPSQQEEFTEFLGPIVAGLTPFVTKIAPRLLKGLVVPGSRLLLSNMANKLDTEKKRVERPTEAEVDTGFGRKLNADEERFLNLVTTEAAKDSESVESFLSTLSTIGDLVGSAVRKAGPVLADVAKAGLPLLLGTKESLPTETSTLLPLAHRAMLAEACLQSFIAMPESDSRKVNFYKKFVGKVKKWGPSMVKAIPFIAKHVGPVVSDVLREGAAQKKQESLLDLIPMIFG
ncbi:extracellular metalloprotease [Nemania sp. NC0429]|nr:extracellular metalloprotease [Nemania sp. NC0429]